MELLIVAGTFVVLRGLPKVIGIDADPMLIYSISRKAFCGVFVGMPVDLGVVRVVADPEVIYRLLRMMFCGVLVGIFFGHGVICVDVDTGPFYGILRNFRGFREELRVIPNLDSMPWLVLTRVIDVAEDLYTRVKAAKAVAASGAARPPPEVGRGRPREKLRQRDPW